MSTPFDDDGLQEGLARHLIGPHPAQRNSQGLGAALMQVQPPSQAYMSTAASPAIGGAVGPARAWVPGTGGPYAPTNNAMRREAQSYRPDLGLVGDLSRTAFNGDFSKDMFENYWLAKGPVQLDDNRFRDILNATEKLTPKHPAIVTTADGTPLLRRQYNFYGNDKYKDSLGTASVFYTPEGRPVGFYDDYDYDCNFSKDRSLKTNIETCIMHDIGPEFGAKDFPLYYGKYVPPTEIKPK